MPRTIFLFNLDPLDDQWSTPYEDKACFLCVALKYELQLQQVDMNEYQVVPICKVLT